MNFYILFATMMTLGVGLCYLLIPKLDTDVYFGIVYLLTSVFLGFVTLDDLIDEKLQIFRKLQKVKNE